MDKDGSARHEEEKRKTTEEVHGWSEGGVWREEDVSSTATDDGGC